MFRNCLLIVVVLLCPAVQAQVDMPLGDWRGRVLTLQQAAQRGTLKRGARGSLVRQLQIQLINAGYPVQVSGVFGTETENQLKAFQRANGMSGKGVFGPKTLHAFENSKSRPKPASSPLLTAVNNKPLNPGDSGEHVKHLQKQLRELGYPVNVDGRYNGLTLSTVQFLQSLKGLNSSGVVTPETVNVLNKMAATRKAKPAAAAPKKQTPAQSQPRPALTQDMKNLMYKAAKPHSRKGLTQQHDPRIYDRWIEDAAKRWGLDPNLLRAVIQTESKFDPRARSETNARGLGQLTKVAIDEVRRLSKKPGNARRFKSHPNVLKALKKLSTSTAWVPALNIEASAMILADYKKRYGSVEAAVTGYNAGNKAARLVKKYGHSRARRKGLLTMSQAATYAPEVIANYRKFQNGHNFGRVAGPTLRQGETQGLSGAISGIGK